MKRFLIAFAFVLLIGLLTVTSVFADLPGSGWWSSLYVQNLATGSVDGTIQMTAYAGGSSTDVYGSESYSFDFGQALAYDPGVTPNYGSGGAYIGFDSSLPSGFEGSVVVSASVPVASVSEIANFPHGSVGTSGGTACARYQGISQDMASTELMMPKVKSNYFNHTTTFYIQAAGAASDVTYNFHMNDGSDYTGLISIDANKMYMLDPASAGVPTDDCGTGSATSPCYGSLTLSATTPIAAVITEHPHTGSPAGYALSTRMQSAADQDTILYHPAVKNDYYGTMNASAAVMNVGTEDAYVQITLTVTNVDSRHSAYIGQQFTDFMILAPGEAQVFDSYSENLGGMPAGTYASAVIESIDNDDYDPQPLISSTNDKKRSSVPGGYGINLYAGYPEKNASSDLAGPTLIEFVGNVTGAVTVQNVGASAATVQFSYYEYGTDNVYVFETTNPLDPGAAINTYGISNQTDESVFTIVSGFTNFSELDGMTFSVIVHADQPIIGLVAENSPTKTRDMCNYEMINYVP
ncbi:MAG: hypothetical protein H0S79_14925 [Anaerolineaceae bacterium]|nr:hypothetical protein [Anaerolineaceae bacterium]